MVPFEKKLGVFVTEAIITVSYSHSIATTAVSLAVSTKYTNVTERHPVKPVTTRRYRPRLHVASLGKNTAMVKSVGVDARHPIF